MIRKGLRRVKNFFSRWFCFGNFLKEKRIQRQKKVIVFICQYIPAWNKYEPLYNCLLNNPEVEVKILCVPEGIVVNELKDINSVDNNVFDFFTKRGYNNIINSLIDKNKWFDLKSLNPEYVLYSRPYNSFMPKEYTSQIVSQYAKVCCILYGMPFSKEDLKIALNDDFFRNVYYYFAEIKESANYIKKRYPLAHFFGLRKSLYLGYPALEQIIKNKERKSHSWDFSQNKFRVMWTPRWTTNKLIGGSNFFTYKDFMIDYAKINQDIDFLYRPHPLMFDNFIKTGELTKDEVENYYSECDKIENISIDKEKEYDATFWGSSVLITDISGIIPEYFITGKPIIFCNTNMVLKLNKYINKILKGCYIASNKNDIERYITEIKRGNDYLKEKRKQIMESLFGDKLYECSEKICKKLCD